MTKLRNPFGTLVDRSPFRWVALSFLAVTLIGAAAYNYIEIDNELTAVALSSACT